MANGDDIASKVGSVIKVAGPWGVIVVLAVLVAMTYLNPTARADPFSGTEAREMQAAMELRAVETRRVVEKQIADLARLVEQHIQSPGHYATAEAIAEMKANQKNIMQALEKIDRRLNGSGNK